MNIDHFIANAQFLTLLAFITLALVVAAFHRSHSKK
jgi:hypothetical protein